jgi:hypothetical protein
MASCSPAAVALVLGVIRNGVDWSSRDGGVCPACGKKRCKVTRTMRWEGATRTRYHACDKCGATFKSLEVERAA